MNDTSRFTVAIISFNVKEKLRCAIESVHRHLPGIPVCVWDNGSTDGTKELVRELFPSVDFHYSPENLFFARGCNELVARCTTSHVLLMNADIQLIDGSTAELVDFMERDASLIAVSPSVRDHGLLRHMSSGILTPLLCTLRDAFWGSFLQRSNYYRTAMGEAIDPHATFYVAKITNCCCMVHRKAFLELGGFCTRQLLYWTEEEFSVRVKRRGLRQAVYGKSIVEHEHGSSTKKLPAQLVRAIYVHDRIRYMQALFGMLPMLLVECALIRPRFWKTAADYFACFSCKPAMNRIKHLVETFDTTSL